MSRRIVIFGGNGFVGKSIAKAASLKFYEVICISRSGKPVLEEPWMNQVTWIKADVFHPEQWSNHIRLGDILINAIGILFEKPAKKITYKKYNYEVVPTIINELYEKKPSLFIFISAAHGLPFFSGYLEWKKQAETFLDHQSFPVIIVRPSLLYGDKKKFSRLMAFPIVQMRKIPRVNTIFGNLNPQPIDLLGKVVIQAIEKRK